MEIDVLSQASSTQRPIPTCVQANVRALKKTPTECSHILPFALRNLNDGNATQTKNHATIWWAIYHYFPDLKSKIGADTINQPANAMTPAFALHEEFGRFTFGFKATNEVCHLPNSHKILLIHLDRNTNTKRRSWTVIHSIRQIWCRLLLPLPKKIPTSNGLTRTYLMFICVLAVFFK